MPSEIEKNYENVYRFPGECRGLPLQAYEIAWSGSREVNLLKMGGRLLVLAVLVMGVVVLIDAVKPS